MKFSKTVTFVQRTNLTNKDSMVALVIMLLRICCVLKEIN